MFGQFVDNCLWIPVVHSKEFTTAVCTCSYGIPISMLVILRHVLHAYRIPISIWKLLFDTLTDGLQNLCSPISFLFIFNLILWTWGERQITRSWSSFLNRTWCENLLCSFNIFTINKKRKTSLLLMFDSMVNDVSLWEVSYSSPEFVKPCLPIKKKKSLLFRSNSWSQYKIFFISLLIKL